MRALLDTNIVIHREAYTAVNKDIGTLFKWLDKARYEKCVHPVTVKELQRYDNEDRLKTLHIRLQNYSVLKTVAPLASEVCAISKDIDSSDNDRNDTLLVNEVFQGRVDILVSEDRKIHKKAARLGIQDRVYSIDGFLEKIVSENPSLMDYKILSVDKNYFGDVNLEDDFFDSFRNNYKGFDNWFNKKADEISYVTHGDGRILSFLYVKVEDENECYVDITPQFPARRRLKIGTFKVVGNGVRLGERFLKIIFDNAMQYSVDEIYVTTFDKTIEQKRLIELLMEWGFIRHGIKKTATGDELVFVRDFSKTFNSQNPKLSYPFISAHQHIFLCPIYPDYHTELFPDSILNTESPINFKESQPHRNALSKVYISRSINRDLSSGDTIIFYRTGGRYKSVVTTIAIVESTIDGLRSEEEFVRKCRKRSVFSDGELKKHWNYNPDNRPFIVNFLYAYSLPKRLNMDKLIELGVIDGVGSAPRGFKVISKEQFYSIIKESQSDESIIVD